MLLPNRHGSSDSYRYGFQGQEKDDEIKGEGNSLNYKYRMHDPRLMRFFAPDPLEDKFPYMTPYQFAGNKPIWSREIEGLESEVDALYHMTSSSKAEDIIKNGFNATEFSGRSNYNWFSTVSDAQGVGVQGEVEIKVKGINTKNAHVVSVADEMAIRAKALAETNTKFGQSFASFDEAENAFKEGKISKKVFKSFRHVYEGTFWNKFGTYLNDLGKDIIRLESNNTFAISDNALKGKAQLWGFKELKGKNGRLAKTLTGLKYGGKALIVVGVATDVYELVTSENIAKTATKKAGGWAGAWAGAKGGAAVGAWAAGWGAIPGAIIGGIGGYFAGEYLAGEAYEALETKGWVPSGKE